jgi:hypothetical protein
MKDYGYLLWKAVDPNEIYVPEAEFLPINDTDDGRAGC